MILKNINNLVEELQQDYNDTHWYRKNINIGDFVCLVKKEHQGTGELSCGTVERLLTSKPKHTRGIKVQAMTDSGEKIYGRVQEIYKLEEK
jgi:uncharacterized repeat protein (TIGR03833 family)